MAERSRFAGLSFREAIRQAALARTADNKCHSHQYRVGVPRLRVFERALQRRRRGIARCSSFAELHALIERHATPGVGTLTVYDTALRIGANLDLEPKRVYLHAGTRQGAAALGLKRLGPTIALADLPSPIRRLTPAEAEDFLCIYNDRFRGGSRVSDCSPKGRRKPICLPDPNK